MTSSESTRVSVASAARALREALDRLGDALSSAHLDGVLAAEAGLSAALANAGAVSAADPSDALARVAIQELQRAQAALGRCRRLGASLNDFVRIRGGEVAAADPYDRTGHRAPPQATARLDART